MASVSIPTTVAPRVGALLRMLASPADGEALNAARALGRTLGGVGLDFHALADIVEHPPVPVVVLRDAPGPERKPRRSRKDQPGGVELDYARRRDVAEALRRGLAGGRLSEWETEFATSILCRLSDGYGRLTEKQAETLRRLLAKVGESSVWA